MDVIDWVVIGKFVWIKWVLYWIVIIVRKLKLIVKLRFNGFKSIVVIVVLIVWIS